MILACFLFFIFLIHQKISLFFIGHLGWMLVTVLGIDLFVEAESSNYI
uniref:Uncharacterized protein n=1 Tax=Rhizophora mucronata TaxID=61149 RepID=A0A2P2KP60_RHIMU